LAEAAHATFPHAASLVFGGCLVTIDSVDVAEVRFCEACRTAEIAWEVAAAARGTPCPYDAELRAAERKRVGLP
jgi:hypothetical protein